MENQAVSIRRPGWHLVFKRVLCQANNFTAFQKEQVYVKMPLPIRRESQAFPIRSPSRCLIRRQMMRHTPLVPAIGIHHINFVIPIAPREKSQLPPIRSPTRIVIRIRMVRQIHRRRARRVCQVYIPIAIHIRCERQRDRRYRLSHRKPRDEK